jgi:hypothetical protein
MSDSPEPALDLELLLLPAWAKQSPDANRYAKFEGREDRPERGRGDRDRRDRPFRREEAGRPNRGDRREGPRRDGPRRDFPRRDGRREERPEPPPLPEIAVALTPEPKGAEALARQIKLTGRAYPLFDVGALVLKKPDRYDVCFSVVKKPDGQPAQPLFLCVLDDSLWLSETEVVAHLLSRHFDTFYSTERVAGEAPKGTYTFVAQCGMSGVVLGPPNYHDYQSKLQKLHAERFARMPFDAFKARVKIVRDEAVVKRWIEEQSFKTVYTALNVADSLKFNSREEVEKHFRATHLANLIKPVESHTLNGAAAQKLPSQPLRALVRFEWESQMRFPLKLVNVLSQQFASHGLQFFKVNKTVTHAAVARPYYLDLEATPVSDGVRRIIEFINATTKCTRRKIFEALAPAPPTPVPVPAPAPPAGEGTATTVAAVPPAPPPEPTPEQQAVISDLHWLVHQGHVIEFANGLIETAKKPLPRPEKPSKPVKSSGAQNTEARTEPTVGAPAVLEPAVEEPASVTEPVVEAVPATEPGAAAA